MVKIEDIYDIIENPEVKNYKFLLIALALSFILGVIIFQFFSREFLYVGATSFERIKIFRC